MYLMVGEIPTKYTNKEDAVPPTFSLQYGTLRVQNCANIEHRLIGIDTID